MIALALPVLIAVAAAAALFMLRRKVRPQLAVVLLTATVAGTAVAATALLALISLVLVFDPHSTTWCERFLGHGSHRALLPGMLLGGVVLLMVARAGRSLVRARRVLAVQRTAPNTAVEVIASSRLIAYARPGRPGHVVVSEGMLEALSGEEQLVLFAHERAHLRHRHHRYIAIADACAQAIPLLAPLSASVRFSCERWADEEAASVVGERKLVARALAVAALADAGAPALSFGGNISGVPVRVEALLDPPLRRSRVSTLLLSLPAVVAVGAALLQTQRLGEVVDLLVRPGQL